MKHLPAPRGEKSFAGGLRGSFLLASLLAATRLLAGATIWAVPLAQRVERDGRLNVLVEDDFDAPSSRTVYRLETDDGENLALDFGVSHPHPDKSLRTGARIQVTGRSDGRTFFVEGFE